MRDAVPGEVIEAPGDTAGQVDPAAPLPPVEALVAVPAPDSPATDLTRTRQVPHRAVIPQWVRTRSSLTGTIRWAAGLTWHVTVFHLVRVPVYAVRLAARSPLGAGRLTKAAWRWATSSETADVRRSVLAQASGPSPYLRLVADHRRSVQYRSAVLVATTAGLVAGWCFGPQPVRAGMILAVLLILGLVGRRDRPLTGAALERVEAPPLTDKLIRSALGSLGLAAISSAMRDDPLAVRVLVVARTGTGWRADIDLPPGATASEVIDKRSRLASGLRRPLGCVWPEVAPEVHEGHLILYVSDKSLSTAKPVPWALARTGSVNIFKPVPIGVDQTGGAVLVTLMFASGLIGSVPRMGKTAALRLLLLAAALDPRVEIHAFNLKGGADLDPLAGVAHALRAGDDPEDMTYLLGDLRRLREDMRRRYKTLRALPREVCPESKVTDDLANRKDLALHPVIIAIDESQLAFEHPTLGAEIRELVEDLVKRGPAAGIMVWLSTQRPDAKSIPTSISGNAVLRLCLKVMGQIENDMVLGTSFYKAGWRATMFTRSDLGVAILAGEGQEPQIVRIAYLDGPNAEVVVDRARAARQALEFLTGLAAGQEPADLDTGSVLHHLLSVWPEQDPDWPAGKVWCDVLATRLADRRPSLYSGWTGEQVTAAVKPHGVSTRQVKRTANGEQTNRRGLYRADVQAALADTVDIPEE